MILKNYSIIGWRSLLKYKASSFINIIGLAVGMTVALLISLWIYDEISFNKVHKHYNRIAQVMWHTSSNGERLTYPYNPEPMGDELRRNYGSDFKYVVMSTFPATHVLAYGDRKISVTGNFMEPEAPDMLSMDMLTGNGNSLEDPHAILISQSTAKTLFGQADPMGKVMQMDNGVTIRITGVYSDLPSNSDFKEVNFIVPWELLLLQEPGLKNDPARWDHNDFQVLVQLNEQADLDKVSAKIRDIRSRKMSKEHVRSMNPVVFLHPMSKWHLYSDFTNGINTGGRIQYVRMFCLIGAFVLLLACVNFMNLSTARSEKRAKEVGIRKTIGARRGQLIIQFFCESLLIAFLAFAISLGLTALSLPMFNGIAGKKISVPWSDPPFWILNLSFCVITGLFAGLYPAFYLSSFKPIKTLKGSIRLGRLAVLPRKALVVFQFTISTVLIVSTLIVFRQIQFAKNRPIGYDRNHLITVGMTPDIQMHLAAIQDELKKSGAIEEMAESVNSTTDLLVDVIDIKWRGQAPNAITDFAFNNVSREYGKTIGWEIKEGRDFSPVLSTDSSAFILNEAAVKIMGLLHPVGETIERKGKSFTIIGVIKDIVFESPYKPVMPSIYYMKPDQGYATVTMKINPKKSIHTALSTIAAVLKKQNPSFPFDYAFVDEAYAHKFNDEVRIGELASLFTVLAIFISCLGLFGLASFIAEQRTKEIGIRKVLGATVLNLWALLSKDFVVLVFISLLLATPLAYYFMFNWLQNYQYRTGIPWWLFAAAGSGAVIISILTVSYQSIKAALANPVKSLRSE